MNQLLQYMNKADNFLTIPFMQITCVREHNEFKMKSVQSWFSTAEPEKESWVMSINTHAKVDEQ